MIIGFCGDIMLGENLFHLGRGIRTRYKNNYKSLIRKDILNNLVSDIEAFVFNFEYSLFQEDNQCGINPYKLVYRGEIESIDFIKQFGNILISNIANNHFAQHGIASTEFTIQTLLDNNFRIIGKPFSSYDICDDKQVIKIWGTSLINENYYPNSYWLTSKHELLQFFCDKFKSQEEFWILFIHWGDEYIPKPSKEIIDLAHKLIDAKIDLIVGHHPHVIQSIELYKNRYIFYSLGNFIFDQNFSNETSEGYFVLFDTTKGKIHNLYKTKQSDYSIQEYFKMEPLLENFSDTYNFADQNEIIRIQAKYRKAMKFEYLRNIYRTSPLVPLFLVNNLLFKKICV